MTRSFDERLDEQVDRIRRQHAQGRLSFSRHDIFILLRKIEIAQHGHCPISNMQKIMYGSVWFVSGFEGPFDITEWESWNIGKPLPFSPILDPEDPVK